MRKPVRKPAPLLGLFLLIAGLVVVYAFALVHLEGEEVTFEEVWTELSAAHKVGVLAGGVASMCGLGFLIDALARRAKRRAPPGPGGMG